ncbi:putative quinol monooxygenase [Nostoc sp. PCC 7107]|uniref:putative quinol monooxygenase n=1 Tax=Nostoc sp. PCC 7107 TaxID=317936 RepID=UPI00029F3ACB|nr:putative quinol monooxygenase [Nostoc sp. PCC 7107]AFY43783.1 Antibiotic biosynthesis monooxygenase [Nostoc sp. PCC 7107]
MLNQILDNSGDIIKLSWEIFAVVLIVLSINLIYMKQQAKATIKKADVPIVVAARFNIKPDKREDFLELSTSVFQQTIAESGVISYSFYEDSNLRNHFIFFEEWKSQEALKFHLKTPYLEILMQKFPEFINGEPNVRVYEINKVDYELPSTTN